jgi:hypothetical protein
MQKEKVSLRNYYGEYAKSSFHVNQALAQPLHIGLPEPYDAGCRSSGILVY